MSVGLSVDFSCHYGVAYMNSEGNEAARLDHTVLNENQQPQAKKKRSFKDKDGTIHKKSLIRNIIDRYNNNNKDRFMRIYDIFGRVGSAVAMAAFTTFLAGFSMYPSSLTSFSKMGQFLMLVMCLSYLFATFFFVPMCALFGPTQDFGNMRLGYWCERFYTFCCETCGCSNKTKQTSSKKPDTSSNSKEAKFTPLDSDSNHHKELLADQLQQNSAMLNTNTSKV